LFAPLFGSGVLHWRLLGKERALIGREVLRPRMWNDERWLIGCKALGWRLWTNERPPPRALPPVEVDEGFEKRVKQDRDIALPDLGFRVY
jgi:hypothetical protein